MAERPLVVFDASVGVKLFRHESGRQETLALLFQHRKEQLRIIVPSQFVLEVISVAVREGGPAFAQRMWDRLHLADLTVVGLDDELARGAFDQCRLLGCSFYDALAPALAERLGARLVSADVRAHARFEGVELIG